MKFCLILLSLICATAASRAALEWESTEITAPAGEKEAIATFHFRNTGSEVVRIYEIRGCCKCTTGKAEKEEYAADEKGTIQMIFTFGGRTGLQKKSLLVRTSGAKVEMLTMIVDIPAS